jgi:hypothetical protein
MDGITGSTGIELIVTQVSRGLRTRCSSGRRALARSFQSRHGFNLEYLTEAWMEEPNTTGTASGANGDVLLGGNTHSGGIVERVRERAAAELSTQKDRAFDGLGTVAQAVRHSTQQLRDQQHGTLATYVEQAADQLERVARQLREKDVGELMEDAQRLARRQPAVFIGSAFALGLVGARFLKSSSKRAQNEHRSVQGDRSAYSQYEAPTAMGDSSVRSSPSESFPANASAGGAAGSAYASTGAIAGSNMTPTQVGQGGSVEPTHQNKPGQSGRSRRTGPDTERS